MVVAPRKIPYKTIYSNYLILYLFSLHAHPHKGYIIYQLVMKGSREEKFQVSFKIVFKKMNKPCELK